MKVLVDQSLLKEALRRSSLGGAQSPALGFVRLSVEKEKGRGVLRLYAASALVQIDLSIACTVDKVSDPIIVHAKSFVAGATAMPNGELLMEVGKGAGGQRVSLKATSGRKWSIATTNLELPKLSPPAGARLTVPLEILERLIDHVRFATNNTSESYESRDGIRLEAEGKTLTAVVYGAHMLLSSAASFSSDFSEPWSGLIPTPVIGTVDDLIQEAKEMEVKELVLSNDGARIYIEGASTLLNMMLPVGEFPNWRRYLSNFHQSIGRVPRLALIASLQALDQSVDENVPSALLTFADGAVKVTSGGQTTDFVEELTLSERREGTVRFRINARYLMGTLRAAPEDPEFVLSDDGGMLLVKTESGFTGAIALMSARSDEGEGPK